MRPPACATPPPAQQAAWLVAVVACQGVPCIGALAPAVTVPYALGCPGAVYELQTGCITPYSLTPLAHRGAREVGRAVGLLLSPRHRCLPSIVMVDQKGLALYYEVGQHPAAPAVANPEVAAVRGAGGEEGGGGGGSAGEHRCTSGAPGPGSADAQVHCPAWVAARKVAGTFRCQQNRARYRVYAAPSLDRTARSGENWRPIAKGLLSEVCVALHEGGPAQQGWRRLAGGILREMLGAAAFDFDCFPAHVSE